VRIENFITSVFDVILTLDANAHVAGDVLSDTVAITLPRMPKDNAALRGEIVSLQVLDEDDQAQDLDVVFLKANRSLGTKNAAVSISDSDARDIIGVVQVTDYIDLINSQQARPSFDPIPFELAAAALYVSTITRGTPTPSAAGMRLRVGIRFHNIEQW
jgi:hypothetical protein